METIFRQIQRTVGAGGHEFIPADRFMRYSNPSLNDNKCFANAAGLVLGDRDDMKGSRYVEGYAIDPTMRAAIHHAWITLDGIHAIEVTWEKPGKFYFGVEYGRKVIADRALEGSIYLRTSQLDPAIMQLIDLGDD